MHVSHKPNKHGINTIIYKHPKHAINNEYEKHVNKTGVTKTEDATLLVSKTWWSSPPNIP